MQTDAAYLKELSISELAGACFLDWKPVHPTAKPYLDAMLSLETLHDRYVAESGISIVSYFLCNVGQWRGEVAKAIKAELKRRIKEYEKEEKRK